MFSSLFVLEILVSGNFGLADNNYMQIHQSALSWGGAVPPQTPLLLDRRPKLPKP